MVGTKAFLYFFNCVQKMSPYKSHQRGLTHTQTKLWILSIPEVLSLCNQTSLFEAQREVDLTDQLKFKTVLDTTPHNKENSTKCLWYCTINLPVCLFVISFIKYYICAFVFFRNGINGTMDSKQEPNKMYKTKKHSNRINLKILTLKTQEI